MKINFSWLGNPPLWLSSIKSSWHRNYFLLGMCCFLFDINYLSMYMTPTTKHNNTYCYQMLLSTQVVLEHFCIHDRSGEMRHKLELESQKDQFLSYRNKFLSLFLQSPVPLSADKPSRVRELADRTISEKSIWYLGLSKPKSTFLSRVMSMPGLQLGKFWHLENPPGI